MALADQDESVRIAVRALGDMRNSTHASSPSTSQDLGDDRERPPPEGSDEWKSLSRVSNIPLVNSALRAYEQSKASSRVVKYGAEMMESSVKSISRPVIDRLPVGQIDDFACRQLDRLGSYARRTSSTSRLRNESPDPRRSRESRDVSMTRGETSERVQSPREDDDSMRGVREGGRGLSQSRTPTPHSSASDQAEKPTLPPASTLTQHADAQESQQVAQRSRWQAMILEAGGLSAAFSEESMRRLRYCLQWLQVRASAPSVAADVLSHDVI
ncbi:hypothetical protein BN946_scf184815.g13 [Trametes cinnabarina]|uniref:Uncharacterized protein n=1 Tax=Pycnoporus cinnabarinus TaxID=5643 RepID=A0A060S2K0_PYCCI|nr:hypothetical protein BN946_scf184815.g13 [Trametes cinnabarina]